MIIRMILQMSGGRYDGRNWPIVGANFWVPDEEGQGLVGCGAAVFFSADPKAKTVPEPKAEMVTEPEPGELEPAAPVAAPAAVPVTPAELARPTPADPKAAWVEYAVGQGASRDDAENRTKVQLQAAYGGRL
jgi:hypothetical protein